MSPDYLDRIQHGVDHIEERLDEPITLAGVAEVAGLSQWHFQRIFRSLTGDTLKGYIRARRMARALDRLSTTELRVLDVALAAGFESQEAFARAFKRAFGRTPIEYRRSGDVGQVLPKLRLDEEMLRHIDANVSRTPELYQQPAMELVGLRTVFFGVESEKNNLGVKLPPLWDDFLARLDEVPDAVAGVCYGIVKQDADDGEALDYYAAIEVAPGTAQRDGGVPDGMAVTHVPPARYAKFEHRGPARAIDRTVTYAYSTWLVGSGMQHTEGPDLEIYDHRYHATDPGSVFWYALPVTE